MKTWNARRLFILGVGGLLAACTTSPEPAAGAQDETAPSLRPQAVSYGSLDASRMPPGGWEEVQWKDFGGWTLIDVTTRGLPVNSPTTDASQKIRDILASTSGSRILYFPAGAYYFKTHLEIRDSNITLRGAGRSSTSGTRFYQQQPSAPGRILFTGTAESTTYPIVGSPALGASQITVSGGNALNVNDMIDVFGDYPEATDTWARDSWGQIVRVTAKSHDSATNRTTLTLDVKLGLDLPASRTPRVRRINAIANVRVQDLYIERSNDNNETGSLQFLYCRNCLVDNIRSFKASDRYHIDVRYSRLVVITNSNISDSWDLSTGGGQAYGINVMNKSTRVQITNNKLWNFRHHIMLQAGANHVVVSYNSLEPEYYEATGTLGTGAADMSLHGGFAHNNLFEGNAFYQLLHDGSHGPNGPRNTAYRNSAWRLSNGWNNSQSQNFMANLVTGSLPINGSGVDAYVAANKVGGAAEGCRTGTNYAPCSLGSTSTLPASLYLASKPSLLGSKAWPLYGYGVADWGSGNTLPAKDRAK